MKDPTWALIWPPWAEYQLRAEEADSVCVCVCVCVCLRELARVEPLTSLTRCYECEPSTWPLTAQHCGAAITWHLPPSVYHRLLLLHSSSTLRQPEQNPLLIHNTAVTLLLRPHHNPGQMLFAYSSDRFNPSGWSHHPVQKRSAARCINHKRTKKVTPKHCYECLNNENSSPKLFSGLENAFVATGGFFRCSTASGHQARPEARHSDDLQVLGRTSHLSLCILVLVIYLLHLKLWPGDDVSLA